MLTTLLVSVLLVSPIFAVPWQSKQFEIKPRIIRGKDAQPGQFKYMASLREVKETHFGDKYNHFCGAALISERYVISVSHCLRENRLNATNIRIVVGANHFWRDGKIYKVKHIIRHENYDNITSGNDISLLQSKTRIKFGEYVEPIPISRKWIEPGCEVLFAGFGVTGAFSLTPLQLQFIELRVISNDECIRRHTLEHQLSIHNSTLCTFIGFEAGAYVGDSGGGLTINNQLVGVLSWGLLGIKENPDQFTRVSEFIEWIEDKTGIKAV